MTPPLIPRKALFGNPSGTQARISPDGARLSWIGHLDGLPCIWIEHVDQLGSGKPRALVTMRGIVWQDWAPDGRNLLLMSDCDGDENWQVFAVDAASGAVRKLAVSPGVSAKILMLSPQRPNTVVLGLNDRDPQWHDVWAVDIASGERELVLKNTYGFWHFTFDWQLKLRLARKSAPAHGGAQIFRLDDGGAEPWLDLPRGDEVATWPLFFDGSDKAVVMRSTLGRDRAALVRIDLASRNEQTLAQHDKADVDPTALLNPASREVDAVSVEYLQREWIALNPEIADDLRTLKNRLGSRFNVDSQSSDNRRWIVTSDDAECPPGVFIYDRQKNSLTELLSSYPDLKQHRLAAMRSVVIPSRDGLDLVSYLTLPTSDRSPDPGARPLVLVVHGGPWSRDSCNFRRDHQWLANRGYAALSVNYRGSTGFGKWFAEAGIGEHAAAIHDDLVDAARWAVENGIADPGKIAIMGASYGGYAALVGLAFTPDLFCCAVSWGGFSNLVTLLEDMPPYWAGFNEFMFRSYGDVRTGEGAEWLRSRSPLFKADSISRPLLIGHGANDVRCRIQESEQIAAAIRQRGGAVTFVVYPEEGHFFQRAENLTSFHAIVEAFLARHLGGHCEPIGDDVAASNLDVRLDSDENGWLQTPRSAR